MKRRDLAIVLGLALLALLFWKLRVVDPGATYASAGPPWKLSMGNGDMFGQIYPGWHRAIQMFQAGEIPLWNPYQFAGHPLHASVLYGVFYPLNLSRFFLSTELALEATAVLHLFVAGLFMYLYGRVIRLGRPAAAVAALVFMLSGSIVLRAVWFTPAIGAAVWLPLAFLAVEKIFRSPRLAWVALLAIAVAMPILAGWLQIWMYSMHAVGLYVGVRWLALLLRSDRRGRALRIGGLVAGGIALGVLLAAVQLLPSWELQQLGPRRPGGLSVEQTITFFGAGPPGPRNLISHLTDARPARFSSRGYTGMLVFVLTPLSLLARRGRVRMAFLWLLASWSIAVSLTTFTPLFDLYRMLPAATWFQAPWRILFLYTFAAAVLSGIGFDQLTRREPAASRRMLLAAALSTLVALGLLLAIDLPTLSRAYLGGGLALIWGTVLVRRARYRHALLAVLIALLAVDLLVANRFATLRPFQALAAYHSEDDLFGFIERNQKLQRTFIAYPWSMNAALIPKQGSLRGIFSITDYEILNLERYGKLYRELSVPGWGINRAGVMGAFNGSLNLEFTPGNLALLDLLSVRFIALDVRDGVALDVLQAAGWRLAHHPRRSRFLVYENPQALPRAYLVHVVDAVATEAEAFRAIQRNSFEPRRSVVLEAPADAVALPASIDATRTARRVRIVRFQPNEVVIETEARAPGFLVLTDSFYPGWKAFVDEGEQPIHRANYLFRAVRVPAGRHTVRFRYEPTSFRAGASISLAALAGILMIAWAQRRRGSTKRPWPVK